MIPADPQTVQPGQVWRHVGNGLVPPSGLRLLIQRVEWPYFYATYPDLPKDKKPRRYLAQGFEKLYEIEVAAPVRTATPTSGGAFPKGDDGDTGAAA